VIAGLLTLYLQVVEYARFLGIDPLREPHLLAIAQEGLVAPLPDGWTEFEDGEGNLYYHQASSNESVWTHPLDAFYRSKVTLETLASSLLLASLELSDTKSPCALNTSPPRNRCTFL